MGPICLPHLPQKQIKQNVEMFAQSQQLELLLHPQLSSLDILQSITRLFS